MRCRSDWVQNIFIGREPCKEGETCTSQDKKMISDFHPKIISELNMEIDPRENE